MSHITPSQVVDNSVKYAITPNSGDPEEIALSKLDHRVLQFSSSNDLHKNTNIPMILKDEGIKRLTGVDMNGDGKVVDAGSESDSDWDNEGEELDERAKGTNCFAKAIVGIQMASRWVFRLLNKLTKGHFVALVFLLAYIAYFIAAMTHEFGDEGSHRLLACTIVGVVILLLPCVKRLLKAIWLRCYGSEDLNPAHSHTMDKVRFFVRWILYAALLIIVLWALVEEGRNKIKNLRALPGLFIFLLIPLLLSSHPGKINWHTVYWGMGLQFLCALFVIKWTTGRKCIEWLQDRFDEFFANSQEGSKFLFGDTYRDHYTIFGALPVLFYTNATLTVLYYLGVMPYIIRVVGQFLNFVLNTSPVESTSVAVGIYMEGLSTVLVLRPFLMELSKSEMFLLVTSCYASLGGAYLAMMSAFGIRLDYLIPAMLVSAPACIAVCKIMMPETRDLKGENSTTLDVFSGEHQKYQNVMDAAMTGAIGLIGVVGEVAVALFTFFSYISFINHTLSWFGDRIGVDGLSIEYLSSYVLYPVALAMGVEPEDCRKVAMLLGYRIGIYNVFAFLKLAEMRGNRMYYMAYMQATNFTGPVLDMDDDKFLVYWNRTLKDGFISDRSEAIITYSLCGFSSFLSVMMVSSIMFALIPKRKKWLTKMIFPSLLAGNLANCMTGCLASIFF